VTTRRPLVQTNAVVLRKVSYRDADLILTVFTEALGKLSCMARGARRSTKRYSGSLEPMHGLYLELSRPARGHLFTLISARLEQPRIKLAESLSRMGAAARMLGWVRDAAPDETQEANLYHTLIRFLDALDSSAALDPDTHLAAVGLRLLQNLGWALELDHCVRCGRPCPNNKAAMVDTAAGGLICSQCGGATVRLNGARRERLKAAALADPSGNTTPLHPEDAGLVLRLVENTLAAHANIGQGRVSG
jgi:DNA repair protein RecO (recombination protein O)